MCRKNIKSFNDKKHDYKTHVSYKNRDIQNFVIKAIQNITKKKTY